MYSSMSILLLLLIVGVIPTTSAEKPEKVFKFSKQIYEFGETIKVSFTNVAWPMKPYNYPYVAIFRHKKKHPKNKIPPMGLMQLWVNDCGSQENCEYAPQDGPKNGKLSFGVSPTVDYVESGMYFPLNPDNKAQPMYMYKMCMLNEVWSEDSEKAIDTKLIGECQLFMIKDYKKMMVKQASTEVEKNKYGQGKSIKATVTTPVQIVNTWVGLFAADKGGKLPKRLTGENTAMWQYLACGNQDGDQDAETCSKTPKKSTEVRLGKKSVDENGINKWPLDAGIYYMCVVFNMNEPFTKYKCSKKIKIVAK